VAHRCVDIHQPIEDAIKPGRQRGIELQRANLPGIGAARTNETPGRIPCLVSGTLQLTDQSEIALVTPGRLTNARQVAGFDI